MFKRKFKIAAFLIILSLILPLFLSACFDDLLDIFSEETIFTQEQADQYDLMAQTQSHFIDNYESIGFAIDEYTDTNIFPKDGIDYSSTNLAAELSAFYSEAAANAGVPWSSFIINDNNAEYNGSDKPPELFARHENSVQQFGGYSNKLPVLVTKLSAVPAKYTFDFLSGDSDSPFPPGAAEKGYYFIDNSYLYVIDADKLPKAESYKISYAAPTKQFHRETLSKAQQRAYDIVMTELQKGKTNIVCDIGISMDDVFTVCAAVQRDHLEFFYIKSFGVQETTLKNGRAIVAQISGVFDEDIQKIGVETALANVKKSAAAIIGGANSKKGTYEKVKYIFEAMVSDLKYADDADNCPYSQNIYSGIVTKTTVCAGYSAAFQYYCNQTGINCSWLASCYHAWNIVEIDGDLYYVDVTWGDPTGGSIDYTYLNFNETILIKINEKVTMPDAHRRDYISVLLPPANGTKWADSGSKSTDSAPATVPATQKSADTTAPSQKPNDTTAEKSDVIIDAPGKYFEYYKIIINGRNATADMLLEEIDGIIYVEAVSYFAAIHTEENITPLYCTWGYDEEIGNYSAFVHLYVNDEISYKIPVMNNVILDRIYDYKNYTMTDEYDIIEINGVVAGNDEIGVWLPLRAITDNYYWDNYLYEGIGFAAEITIEYYDYDDEAYYYYDNSEYLEQLSRDYGYSN
jgi:hypothetical protein